MAFNFGAFAGGLAKGGLDTYSTLTDIEAKQQETKRREAEFGAWQKDQAGKEALRTAIAEQGGEKTFTPNFSGTGGMDSNDVAPTPVQMSASERRAAIEQRAIAGGADPEAAMRYTASRRSADLSNAFDATMDKLHKEAADRMSSIKATAEAGGLKGLAETFGPELKKAFGHDIQFKAVPGAAGEIVAMDGKKVVARYNSLSDATQTLEGLVGQEFESKFTKAMMQPGMFGSAKELSDFAFKRQEMGLKGREVAAKEKDVESSGVYRRALASRAGQTQGQAMNEKITALGAVYRRADPSMSVEAAEKKAAQELVKSPDARSDLVTAADVNKFLETHGDAPEMKVKGKNGKMELRPLEERIGIARRALGGGAAPAASGKLAQAFAAEGDPFAEKKTEPKKTEPTKADTALPARPEAPARNMYLEQMAQADARRKAAIEARLQREAEEEREAALADERAAANRRAIGANFDALYGRTR